MDLAAAVFVLCPFQGLLACVFVHVLVSRTAPTLPRLHVIVGSVLVGLSVVSGMVLSFAVRDASWMSAADQWGSATVWILTYLSLAYCYVIGFFYLGETARRIRLLIELHAAGERGMTLQEILATYHARMIVEARLHRLRSGGQIVERGGRYFVKTPLMLYLAKLLVLLKIVFLRSRSEFSSHAANNHHTPYG